MITKLLLPRFRPLRNSALAALCAFSFANSAAQAAQVWMFDFGGSSGNAAETAGAWNNINLTIGQDNAGALMNLVDTSDQVTDVDFLMLARFNNTNTNGTTSSTLGYPTTATQDSLYGNTLNWEGQTNVFPRFKLASLDPGLAYDLTFYASRTGVTGGENRETLYTVTGSSVSVVALNAANNVNNTVSVFGMIPNEFGEIEVGISPGPNNNNANSFTYLNVMTLAVPEPASVLFLVAGTGLILARRQRRAA